MRDCCAVGGGQVRYINGEEIKYDFTKPKTYIRPVFESLEDEHIRMHHIDVDCSFKKSKFVPIEHMSKQRRRTFELEEENAKLHGLIEAVLQCAGEIKRDKGCDACPMWNGDDDGAFRERRWCLLRPTLREVGFEVGEWRVGDDGRLHRVKEVKE